MFSLDDTMRYWLYNKPVNMRMGFNSYYQRSVRRGMLLGIVVYGMCIDKQPLGTTFVTRHIMQADVETEAAPDEFSAIIVEIPLHIGANAFKLRYGVIFLTGFLG